MLVLYDYRVQRYGKYYKYTRKWVQNGKILIFSYGKIWEIEKFVVSLRQITYFEISFVIGGFCCEVAGRIK